MIGNGYTKELKSELNILIDSGANSEHLMQAMAKALVHTMDVVEKEAERRKELDLKLFGNDKLQIEGFISQVTPMINDYKRFRWIVAIIWIPITALFGYIGAWFKLKITGHE